MGDESNDDDRAWISNDSEVANEDVAIDDGDKHEKGTPAIKVLSEKTNDDIKKRMEMFRKTQSMGNEDDSIGLNCSKNSVKYYRLKESV